MFAPTPANDEPVFESFPEYNIFPAHWDLSELDAPARATCRGHGEQSAQSPTDGAETEPSIPVSDAYPVFSRDPFPKLRTFPVYWDLSR